MQAVEDAQVKIRARLIKFSQSSATNYKQIKLKLSLNSIVVLYGYYHQHEFIYRLSKYIHICYYLLRKPSQKLHYSYHV